MSATSATTAEAATVTPYAVLENVSLSSKDFDIVADLVTKTFPHACILSIERIINTVLNERFEARRAHYIATHGPDYGKDVTVYHGTNSKAILPICNNGFEAGRNTRCVFGRGSYFATSFGYSHGFTDVDKEEHSYMLICKILPGRMCRGSHGMVIDRSKYDCGTDNAAKPSLYAMPQDDAILPLFVVMFHKNAKK